jgi:dienelactone hydrolase
MRDTQPTRPDPGQLDEFLREQARQLRAGDQAPATRPEWMQRRQKLRQQLLAASGSFPEQPCPLGPRVLGTLKRSGYRIEKLIFQSQPDVWVTASAYVPEPLSGKAPAVLVVHGHWAGARRDPVVQARCLGLVKLGFFVLAVDAFAAGERHPRPAPGTYHGALMGSTLWPVGQTLLGMQVYDNRRAVDYLLTRPEVDGQKLGITGASGGGNQSMYAGALDERFQAVVPVCSVGNYQAYLRAACCVCEVVPGALRFTEEGDVLGLTAPRALLVINATRDAYQFSVAEAKKSLERTKAIYALFGQEDKVAHAVFESPHAYNQPMREAMYGWMTRWLKKEGDGQPIPEPKHDLETAEDLACFPDGDRPKGFLFPATFARREADRLLAPLRKRPDHKEAWEAVAQQQKSALRQALGEMPKELQVDAKFGEPKEDKGTSTVDLTLRTEPGLILPARLRHANQRKDTGGKVPACVLLHLDGETEAFQHLLAGALAEGGWVVIAPDLRGIGTLRSRNDGNATAPDHNSAEHAVWIGRPLLGQWLVDLTCLLAWLEQHPGHRGERLAVVGIGQAGLVALCAAALLDKPIAAVAAVDAPASLLVAEAYPTGWRMGLLAPGLLRAGDVPQLAALAAPRRLLIAGGVVEGKPLAANELEKAYEDTRHVYQLQKAADKFKVTAEAKPADLASWLRG